LSKFNLSEFTKLLTAAGEKYREDAARVQRTSMLYETQRVKNRRAVGQALAPVLSKAGLDVD
jgi:hypothetical protein